MNDIGMIVNKRTFTMSEIEKQRVLDIYVESFSALPRLEIIDRQKIDKEMFSENNFISLLVCKEKINGFIFSTDIAGFGDVKLLDVKNERAAYIESFAVVKEQRNNGMGKEMLAVHLEYLGYYFDTVYTRSRIDINNIVKIFLTSGFEIIKTYETITNGEKSIKNIYKRKLD